MSKSTINGGLGACPQCYVPAKRVICVANRAPKESAKPIRAIARLAEGQFACEASLLAVGQLGRRPISLRSKPS